MTNSPYTYEEGLSDIRTTSFYAELRIINQGDIRAILIPPISRFAESILFSLCRLAKAVIKCYDHFSYVCIQQKDMRYSILLNLNDRPCQSAENKKI